jgi:hypothetical protein
MRVRHQCRLLLLDAGWGPAETSFGPIADGYGNGNGRIWAFHTEEQVLQLIYQSPGPDVLDFPDNVTTIKRGTLVVCKDNVNDNYLRGLTRGGQLFDIALNRLVSQLTGLPRFNDEFAGTTLSPDGETLFVNTQASRRMTFAIRGSGQPFQSDLRVVTLRQIPACVGGRLGRLAERGETGVFQGPIVSPAESLKWRTSPCRDPRS